MQGKYEGRKKTRNDEDRNDGKRGARPPSPVCSSPCQCDAEQGATALRESHTGNEQGFMGGEIRHGSKTYFIHACCLCIAAKLAAYVMRD